MAFFPKKQADLNNYFHIVCAYILANMVRLLVSVENKAKLIECMADWDIKYPIAINPDLSTHTAIVEKNNSMAQMMKILRTIFKNLIPNVLTEKDRSTMNLPAEVIIRGVIPVPVTKPAGDVNASERFKHLINFHDSEAANAAKPYGVHSCQIWQKIGGTAPVSQKDLVQIGNCTCSPFETHFEGTEGGLIAYYWIRWENSKGEFGPWSDLFSATIKA